MKLDCREANPLKNPSRLFCQMLRSLLLGMLLMLVTISSGMAATSETVRLATLNWSPYIGEKLEAEGYAAEVIRTAFERSGYSVKFYYMPWGRAVDMVSKGSYNGLCPAYYTEERAEKFSMSDAFPAGPLMFAKRRDTRIDYNSLRDLAPYKIAVVRGYANTKAFDTAGYLQKSFTIDDQTGYRRLLFGRVDLWLADKFVAQYTMSQHLPERADEIAFINKPLAEKTLHVAFTKSKPNYKALTQAFNTGLKSLLNDGSLEQILRRHHLSLD
jgi:polar amino acid transport system substrate-binding protein